jgi:2C-methyl-D-erythritol 2,4-cyclodiphosphate synthase
MCGAQPHSMSLSNEPVTLSAEQVEELRKKLSSMRHDVNNHLSLIVAAAELIKLNPEALTRMAVTLTEQPPKISEQISRFSAELEKALRIQRG